MALKKPGQRGYKPRHNAKPKGQQNADMFSYDNALPCKNPKCASVNRPHPNCKCYGSAKSMPHRRLTMADGGTVPHFCDTDQAHNHDCEYYADGGDVAPQQEMSPSLAQSGSELLANLAGSLPADDDHSQAMLGRGDPEAPTAAALAHMGAMDLFGDDGAKKNYFKDSESSKMAANASDLLDGMGHAANGVMPIEPKSKWFKHGSDLVSKIPEMISNPDKEHLENKFGALASGYGGKYGIHAALKTLGSGNPNDLYDCLSHSVKVSKGAQKISKGIDGLFDTSSKSGDDHEISESKREKLKKYIEEGMFNKSLQASMQNPQSFASGGVVAPEPEVVPFLSGSRAVANNFPEQDMLLQAAKGRINNYLNSVRPLPSSSKLPFDKEMKDPEKHRAYDRALDIANQPLSILGHVKKGTLTVEALKHFSQMYPELHNHLSKKMTERISQSQLDEEKPTYRTRQAMSMFLGSPLDSTMTPASMQAIQNTFAKTKAANAQEQQPQGNVKKGSGKLDKLSKQLETNDQGRAARANGANTG